MTPKGKASCGDAELLRRLLDLGFSAGEAARVTVDARTALDFTVETVNLAAARVLDREAHAFAELYAERKRAAHELRQAPERLAEAA